MQYYVIIKKTASSASKAKETMTFYNWQNTWITVFYNYSGPKNT